MRCQIRYWIRSQTRNSWATFLLRCFYQRFGWEFYSWGIPQSDDFVSVFWQLPKVHKKRLLISAARDKHHNFGFCAFVSACDRLPLWSGQKKCISVDIYPSQFPAWKCHWLRSTWFNIWIISCWLNWIHKVPIWIFNGVEQQNICQPEDVFGSLHFIPRAFNRPCDPSYLTSKRWHIKDGCALKPDQGTDEFEVRDKYVFIDLNDI